MDYLVELQRRRRENLRKLLSHYESQRELSDVTGVAVAQISHILTGVREMGDAIARKIESALGKPLCWLDQDAGGGNGFANVEPGPEIVRRVPLISWVQAGQWNEVCDVLPLESVMEWIPALARVGPRAFALRIQGDSMEPKFPVGAAIVVEPDVHAQHGDYVIVRLDGTDECTFKQLVEDAGSRFLKPLNPRYPLIEINSHATVVGIVKGMWLSV